MVFSMTRNSFSGLFIDGIYSWDAGSLGEQDAPYEIGFS
jgi:hypothetical protein